MTSGCKFKRSGAAGIISYVEYKVKKRETTDEYINRGGCI
jgi:hypothetical protein